MGTGTERRRKTWSEGSSGEAKMRKRLERKHQVVRYTAQMRERKWRSRERG